MASQWGSDINTLWMLRVLRRSAIAATMLVLAAAAWLSWDYLLRRAETSVSNSAALVESFMLRLVRTQDVMLTAADAALGQFAIDPGYSREAELFLRALAHSSGGAIGIAFIRSDGEVLVSNIGAGIGNVGDREYLEQTPADGLYIDRIQAILDGSDALVITRRSAAASAQHGVWAIGLSIEVLREFLERVAAGTEQTASVFRADGRLLARDAPLDERERASGAVGAVPTGFARGGVFRTEALRDGREHLVAAQQVGDLPLYATFGVTIQSIWRDWALVMTMIGAVVGTLGASAYLTTRYVERIVRAEAAQAALAFDRRLLEEAEKTATLKETLLRELNHRVKNSLQMIQALVRLQRGRPTGPDLSEIEARVLAIATIHDLLYQSSGDFEVDFGELLRRVMASPAVVPPESGIRLEVAAERIVLDASAATPLALCAVELVTNAAKHAYRGGIGRIEVVLARRGADHARLTIADQGQGMPREPGRRSGLRVVEELVRQLEGRLELDAAGGGTRFSIDFPLTPAEDRTAARHAAS